MSNYFRRFISSILYRLESDPVKKKIIEINRSNARIKLKGGVFHIQGCDLEFDLSKHGFIIEGFEKLQTIMKDRSCQLMMIGDKLAIAYKTTNVFVSTEEELFLFKEVFINHCYNIRAQEDLIVFDIGMNCGFASLFFSGLRRVKKVYGFELFGQTYNRALENIDLNKGLQPGIQAFNVGLSDETIEKSLEYSFQNKARLGVKGVSNIKNHISDLEFVKVRLEKASNLINPLLDLNGNNLLKVDTEGSEKAILKDLESAGLLKYFKYIIIEWHDNDIDELDHFLESNDFCFFSTSFDEDNTGMIYAVRNS